MDTMPVSSGDARVRMDGPRGYGISLEQFEGPLDLLLHLVRRHELDILDIPIAFVAEKYMQFLALAQALDIEVAGEYLVMAATLAYLKSRELLPSTAEIENGEVIDGEDGPDPREALIRRLVEYERFKHAALAMGDLPQVGRDVFVRGSESSAESIDVGLAPIALFKLAETYTRILERARIRKSHEVEIEAVTVRQRMVQLGAILAERERFEFESLFFDRIWQSERELRAMVVVSLMSVLELAKLGVLNVAQPEGVEALVIERAVEVTKMLKIIRDFRGDDESAEALLLEESENDDSTTADDENGDGAPQPREFPAGISAATLGQDVASEPSKPDDDDADA